MRLENKLQAQAGSELSNNQRHNVFVRKKTGSVMPVHRPNAELIACEYRERGREYSKRHAKKGF